jgi:hypothetical protein
MPDDQKRPLEEDRPRGLLYLLEPEFAHLIEPEHKFEQKIARAAKQGRLYLSNPNTRH